MRSPRCEEATIGNKNPTTTSSSYNAPTDQASGALTIALNKARQASKAPFQPYTGELTAGVNAQEQAGIDSINGLQSKTDAYLGQASGLAQGATAAVTPGALNLQQFENPYQSDVINATMAQIANQNAQQRQGQTSSAISAGAFGGDRAGVAQAVLANQQDLASNATLAGLNQANYTQALAAAQQQQGVKLSADQSNRDALAAGSQLYAGLGSLANSTGLANAGAQLQGGILQQQTQQAADTAKYTQFQNQQAYPFQTAQFLAGITGSLAPELGGTSSGTQQQSAPNVLNSIIGGGLGLGTFFLPKADGGRVVDLDVERRARGGRTLGGDMDYAGLGAARRYASGGIASMPYADAGGYVPAVGLAQGRAPQFGSTGMQAQPQPDTSMSNLSAGLGMATKNFLNNSNAGDAVSDFAQDRLGFADGGKVISLGLARAARGYDDGGVVSPDPLALTFDANALGDPSLLGGLQPGLSVAKAPDPSSMTPPAPIARPAAPVLAPPQMGLDAAAASPPATPGLAAAEKVPPMAPAPNVTPIVGYRDADGTVTPAPGLAAADASNAPASGLAAINKAAPVSPDSMDSYYGRVRAIESSGGDNSATSPAGATGAYQIMPATWADLSKRHPDLGLTPDGMRDPGQQNAAVRALTADNTAQLKSALGRDPTPAELYLAHQQGASGAISMLTNPNARAGDLVGDKAIAMNGGDPNMKAGDFAGMWSSKFNGATPAGAMAFAGTPSAGTPSAASSQAGLGSAAAPTSGLAAAASTGWGLLDSIIPGGIHVSDDARTALLAASLGMMASPSRSVGQALGQGGLEGVKQYQALQKLGVEKGLGAANIANLQSQVTDRPLARAQADKEIELKHQEIMATLQKIALEGQNYKSEDAYRKGIVGNETAGLQQKRYEMIPGPDGSFRYLDKQNPGAGLLTSGQMPAAGAPGAPVSGASTATVSPSSGAPASGPGTGAATKQQPTAPTQLDSSNFQKTGNPTLSVPQGYLPTNYWQNVYRSRTDPVTRETLARQSVEDVADSNKRASKAYGGLFYSDEMDKAIAGLPQSGPLAPGGFFNERLSIAKNWNAFASGVPGLSDLQADPGAVAKGESLIKDKTRLSADLTQALGSREAASVYSSMMSAVPGADNTRAGYKAVSSAIRTLSQREIDHNTFLQDWSARYGNTNGAEVAFNQLNPPMLYARQAEALARIPQQATDLLRSNANDPRTIANFESTYGPGTARYFTGQVAK